MDIYEIIFLLHIFGALGISGLKVYNLLRKGEVYNLAVGISLFVMLLITWFFGLVVLATQLTLIYSIIFQLSGLFLVCNFFFLIIEIIFYLQSKVTETQERYTAG